MALTNPYRQHNYIGEYATDAAALTFIQAAKWDSAGNGTGTPQNGMCYYNTTWYRARTYLNGQWHTTGETSISTLYRDDFVGTTSNDWVTDVSGTGSSAGLTSDGTRTVAACIAGGSNNRYARLWFGTRVPFILSRCPEVNIYFRCATSNANNYQTFGFIDNGLTNYIQLRRTGTGNWLTQASKAGVSESKDSGVASDTNYHHLRITSMTTGVTEVQFHLNGTLIGTHNNTTYLPTVNMCPAFLCYSTGDVGTIYIDAITIWEMRV